MWKHATRSLSASLYSLYRGKPPSAHLTCKYRPSGLSCIAREREHTGWESERKNSTGFLRGYAGGKPRRRRRRSATWQVKHANKLWPPPGASSGYSLRTSYIHCTHIHTHIYLYIYWIQRLESRSVPFPMFPPSISRVRRSRETRNSARYVAARATLSVKQKGESPVNFTASPFPLCGYLHWHFCMKLWSVEPRSLG